MEDGRKKKRDSSVPPPIPRKTMGPIPSGMPSRPATPPPPAPEGRITPSAPPNAVNGLIAAPSSSDNMEEWAKKVLDWKEKNDLQVQKLQVANRELEEINRGLSEQLAGAISDLNQALENYASAYQMCNSLSGELGTTQEELRATEARNESLLAEKAGLSASLDEAREEAKALTDRLRLAENNSAYFRGELKSLRETYEKCQADLTEAQQERSVFRRQVEGLESGEAERVGQIDDLRQKLADANEAFGKKDAEVLTLQKIFSEVTSRQEGLAAMMAQLESYAYELKDAELSATVKDGQAKVAEVQQQADELSARLKGGEMEDEKKTVIREKTPVAEEKSGLDQPMDLSGMRPTVVAPATTYSWQLMVLAMVVAFAAGAVVALVGFYPSSVSSSTSTAGEADEEDLPPMAEEEPAPVPPNPAVPNSSPAVSEPDTAQVADTLRVKNNAPAPEVPTKYEKVADCGNIADPKKLAECIDFVNPGRVSDCEVGEGQEALRGACLKKVAEKLLGK